MKVKYIGYIGKNNLGDELIYEVNKKLFSKWEFVDNDSQINFFGGGTLLPFWCSEPKNKVNIAFGVGVKSEEFYNKFSHKVNPFFQHITKEHIQNVRGYFDYIGVRGHLSKKQLNKWSISCKVIGDTGLAVKTKKTNQKNTAIINIGSVDEKWKISHEKYLSIMKNVCNNLSKDYEIVFVEMNPSDRAYTNEMSPFVNKVYKDLSVKQALDIFSKSYLTIGERLHTSVLSAVSGRPFISLSYRPKCDDFADSLGLRNFAIQLNKLNYKTIKQKIKTINHDYDRITEKMNLAVNRHKEMINTTARYLMHKYQ